MSKKILKGATNKSVEIYIIDSTDGTPETGVVFNSSGIDLKYRREGAAVVSITEIDLTTPALTDAHEDGGVFAIGNGWYRFDIPDAAFAPGADSVLIFGTVTGMIVMGVAVQLVDYDPEDGVRLGLTALPNAASDAAGGLPISDAGGLDLDTKLANTNEITVARMGALTDWINGGRLDLILDIIAADVVNIDGAAMRGTDSALTDKAGYSLSAAGTLAIWHEALTNIVTASTIGKLLKDEITSARMATLTDWVNGGRLDLLLDAIQTDLDNGTDGLGALKALIDTVDDYVDTEIATLLSDLTAVLVDTSTTLDTKINAIKTITDALPDAGALTTLQADTDDIQTRLPATLVSGRMDSNMSAIDDSATAAANLKEAAAAIATGVVGSASTVTNIVTSSMSPSAAVIDQFKGQILSFAEDTTTVNLRGQKTDITGNTAAGALTVTALTTAPVSGDTFSVT